MFFGSKQKNIRKSTKTHSTYQACRVIPDVSKIHWRSLAPAYVVDLVHLRPKVLQSSKVSPSGVRFSI